MMIANVNILNYKSTGMLQHDIKEVVGDDVPFTKTLSSQGNVSI